MKYLLKSYVPDYVKTQTFLSDNFILKYVPSGVVIQIFQNACYLYIICLFW